MRIIDFLIFSRGAQFPPIYPQCRIPLPLLISSQSEARKCATSTRTRRFREPQQSLLMQTRSRMEALPPLSRAAKDSLALGHHVDRSLPCHAAGKFSLHCCYQEVRDDVAVSPRHRTCSESIAWYLCRACTVCSTPAKLRCLLRLLILLSLS
jgi:hypothetical protein